MTGIKTAESHGTLREGGEREDAFINSFSFIYVFVIHSHSRSHSHPQARGIVRVDAAWSKGARPASPTHTASPKWRSSRTVPKVSE